MRKGLSQPPIRMHGKINARVQIFPPETVLQEKSKQTHARSRLNRFYKIWHKRQRISSSGSLQTDLWKIKGLWIKFSVGWCETTWLLCPAGEETSSRVHLKKMYLFKCARLSSAGSVRVTLNINTHGLWLALIFLSEQEAWGKWYQVLNLSPQKWNKVSKK